MRGLMLVRCRRRSLVDAITHPDIPGSWEKYGLAYFW